MDSKDLLFNNELIKNLLTQAKTSSRLRQHLDLRNSASDTSQRMLNALLPGTEVPIHRHEETRWYALWENWKK